VESFKRFEEFTGKKTTMEVLGAERYKALDDYIGFTAEHAHSSNKKSEENVKPHHGIARTALTLDNNSRKRNSKKKQ
jgi:hypothetical protein